MAEKKKKSKSPESTPWAVCGRCGKNVAEYAGLSLGVMPNTREA